jgi:hypothetical protein
MFDLIDVLRLPLVHDLHGRAAGCEDDRGPARLVPLADNRRAESVAVDRERTLEVVGRERYPKLAGLRISNGSNPAAVHRYSEGVNRASLAATGSMLSSMRI